MQSEKFEMDHLKQRLLDAIDSCRGGVMDTFELEFGDHPSWKTIRARLLRCFGDRGLSGRVCEILDRKDGGLYGS